MSQLHSWMLVLLLPIVVMVMAIVLGSVARRKMGGSTRKRDDVTEGPSCEKCGYPLEGLNFPRCPECGTLRGFDVPIDDLNLTDEERKLVDEQCRGTKPPD